MEARPQECTDSSRKDRFAGHRQGQKASLGTEWLDGDPRSPDSGTLTVSLTELQEAGARTAATWEVGTAPLRTVTQGQNVAIRLLARAWHGGLRVPSAVFTGLRHGHWSREEGSAHCGG